MSRFGSHRHCHKPRLALRFWPRYNTHTHTHSLSLSHFPFSLRFIAQCHLSASRHTPWPHTTHLGCTSRISASHHAPRPHVTHLHFASHISAFHSPFGFYFIFVYFGLRFPAQCHISALRHVSRLHVTRLGLTSHTSASHYTPCFAFSPFHKPLLLFA